jgi:hypothetical protein
MVLKVSKATARQKFLSCFLGRGHESRKSGQAYSVRLNDKDGPESPSERDRVIFSQGIKLADSLNQSPST